MRRCSTWSPTATASGPRVGFSNEIWVASACIARITYSDTGADLLCWARSWPEVAIWEASGRSQRIPRVTRLFVKMDHPGLCREQRSEGRQTSPAKAERYFVLSVAVECRVGTLPGGPSGALTARGHQSRAKALVNTSDYTWAIRAPAPNAGSFKQPKRRPWARDEQIGSDCDARTTVSQRVPCATTTAQYSREGRGVEWQGMEW
jgi:hypothetical protein